MPLRVRRYSPADEDALFAFRETIYPKGHKSLDKNHFRWKFLRHPYATELPFFIMEDDNRVVGTQGYWPFHLNLGNKRITCGHLVDFNVDEAYRGLPTLKLFKAVSSCSDMNFGAYISSDARRFFTAANWIDLSSQLKNYYCFLHVPAKTGITGKAKYACRYLLSRAKNGAMALKGCNYQFKIELTMPDQVDQIRSGTNSQKGIYFIKEKKFLLWRYEQSALNRYNFASLYRGEDLKCFLVFSIVKDCDVKRCFIMDIIHAPGNESLVKILLSRLAKYLKKYSDALVLQSSALPVLGQIFNSCGFSSTASRVGLMLSDGSRFLGKSGNLSRFNFNLGDTDFL